MGTSFIIDTSAYSNLQRGDDRLRRIMGAASEIYVPTIVVGELKAGFAFGKHQAKNEKLLERFIADPIVSIINISDATPNFFASVYAELRRAGLQIGQNDIWIAALCLELSLPILADDSGFDGVKGLERV